MLALLLLRAAAEILGEGLCSPLLSPTPGGAPVPLQRVPVCRPAWEKGGHVLISVPMCVLVCMDAGTWCKPQIWAETGSLHARGAGHSRSPAGGLPVRTKPCVPTHVPSAFLTTRNRHIENHVVHVAGSVGMPSHTRASLPATASLRIRLPLPHTSVYLCAGASACMSDPACPRLRERRSSPF